MTRLTRAPKQRSRRSAGGGRPPRTAFVLSGGASLGAMQAGMLRALYEEGIQPDFLVGTSAGALNAAFIASRPQTAETADKLAAVWHGVRREQVFPLSLRALLVGLAGRRDHLVPDRGLRELVARHVEFADLVDAPVPVHIVAFDLKTRSEILLSQGSTVEALTEQPRSRESSRPCESANARSWTVASRTTPRSRTRWSSAPSVSS